MAAVDGHTMDLGVAPACEALGVVRATFYRNCRPARRPVPRERMRPACALSPVEKQQVLAVLHDERFVDMAPAQVYATLLDEEQYLCSTRTMYRILEEAKEVRERRNQLRHPVYSRPELLATAPNQVWSWDITKLLGPVKWTYFYLYVILDIFSRFVVGWLLARRESAALAKRLISETCTREKILPSQLTVHSDRGPSMTSQGVAQLMATLGIVKSLSRPYTSDDNPFSESQFKTLKYRPEFPNRFDSFEHALECCRNLFPWYNFEHRHSEIGYLAPAMVHYGRAGEVIQARQAVLDAVYEKHPERFFRGRPRPQQVPAEVWINPPEKRIENIVVRQ
jgi:putative transposase